MKSKAKIGVVHGRFQIFHLDHLEYILNAIELSEQLFIGITSYDIRNLAQNQTSKHRSVPFNNPLTYRERTEMISQCLIGKGVDECKFRFTPFPIEEPNKIKDFIPQESICFTTIREPWNRHKVDLLIKNGFVVNILKEDLNKKIEGSKLRLLIANENREWINYVPLETKKYIEKNKINERIIAAYNKR